MAPSRQWATIAQEPATLRELYVNYVMILAAVPAGAVFFGRYLRDLTLGQAAARGVNVYLVALLSVYLLAGTANVLAPRFGGERRLPDALKLAAYATTPFWLAGVFLIHPDVVGLYALGSYSAYVFYTGVTPMMRVPPGWRAVTYAGLVLMAAAISLVATVWKLAALQEMWLTDLGG